MASLRALRRGATASIVVGVMLLGVGLPLVTPLARAVAAGSEIGYPHYGLAPDVNGTSNSTVNVTMNVTDAPAFQPSAINVTVNQTVSLTIVNRGNYSHTFTLSSNGSYVLPTNITPENLSLYFQQHPPIVNVTLNASQTVHANFTMNGSTAGGRFEYVSVVPYQFQAGMYGFVSVAQLAKGPPMTFYTNATNDLHFVPAVLDAENATSLPVKIVVDFGNVGSLSHTFTLSPIEGYNLSPSNFTTFFSTHHPLVDMPVPTSPGTYNTGSAVILKKGFYEFICTVPGHFASGMFGFLYVGVKPPVTVGAPLSTAIVSSGVLVAGAAVLGIGIVLAVIATYSGRIPRKPPSSEHHY
jgi:uncharacterized cupredoxin-like copper-binding protein